MLAVTDEIVGWCVSCDRPYKNTKQIVVGYENKGRVIKRAGFALCPHCAAKLADALRAHEAETGVDVCCRL